MIAETDDHHRCRMLSEPITMILTQNSAFNHGRGFPGARYDFLIVADEVYQLLSYTSTPPPPMTYYDTSERVLSLGSFSKILAPGLRLGWIQAKPGLMEPFIKCGYLESGGGLNSFVSSIVNSMIELDLQENYLKILRETYTDRLVTLSRALQQHIPSLKFTDPSGYMEITGNRKKLVIS